MYCSEGVHLCKAGKAAEAPPVLCKSCRRVYKTPLCLRPQTASRRFWLCKSETCCQTCRAATGSPQAICSLATLRTASPCSRDSHSIGFPVPVALCSVANFLSSEAQETFESCATQELEPCEIKRSGSFQPTASGHSSDLQLSVNLTVKGFGMCPSLIIPRVGPCMMHFDCSAAPDCRGVRASLSYHLRCRHFAVHPHTSTPSLLSRT